MRTKPEARLLLAALALCCVNAGARDSLEQETISIRGNQGLPNTLYIAPWKRVGAPLPSEVPQGEIGEEREPLEREVFRRELELQRQGYSLE